MPLSSAGSHSHVLGVFALRRSGSTCEERPALAFLGRQFAKDYSGTAHVFLLLETNGTLSRFASRLASFADFFSASSTRASAAEISFTVLERVR